MRPSTSLLFVLALTLPAISAAPAAQSAPAPDQQTAPQPAPPAVPTIQVYSRETVVDVVVTDPKGQPVRGLRKSDFIITEDAKPQPIRSFGEFDVETTAPTIAPTLASGIHTNLEAAPTSGPVNIILIDALHSNWVSATRALQATSAYAAHMPRGTELAVFWLSVSGTHMLQGFTSDPAAIRNAVAPLRTDIGTTGNCYTTDRLTIDALNQIADYVAAIKGRKNLLWFTPGMPLYLLRDGGYGWGTSTSCQEAGTPHQFGAGRSGSIRLFTSAGGTDALDMTEVHRLMDTYEIFTAEQIAVSPVSPEGVIGLGRQNLVAEAVAEQSGGFAKYNNNDLTAEIGEAIATGSHYYTISYVPPRQKDDGHYHTITVQIDRPGLRLVYRKGYNSEDPRQPRSYTGPALIKAALQGRAPSATQLLFDAKLAPVAPPAAPPATDATQAFDPFAAAPAPAPAPSASAPSKSNSGGKSAQKPSKTPTRTPYDLVLAIPQSQIAYATGPDGTHTVKLEFAFDAYDLNGKLLGDHSQNVSLDLTPERYQRFIQGPVVFHEQLAFFPGPLFLRVGVLDGVSNKVGTLEIPLTVPRQ
jgi:VWFA-related protein